MSERLPAPLGFVLALLVSCAMWAVILLLAFTLAGCSSGANRPTNEPPAQEVRIPTALGTIRLRVEGDCIVPLRVPIAGNMPLPAVVAFARAQLTRRLTAAGIDASAWVNDGTLDGFLVVARVTKSGSSEFHAGSRIELACIDGVAATESLIHELSHLLTWRWGRTDEPCRRFVDHRREGGPRLEDCTP